MVSDTGQGVVTYGTMVSDTEGQWLVILRDNGVVMCEGQCV